MVRMFSCNGGRHNGSSVKVNTSQILTFGQYTTNQEKAVKTKTRVRQAAKKAAKKKPNFIWN